MLATFAESGAGQLYGRVCERYGKFPDGGIEDDVMAFNLATAIAVTSVRETEAEAEEESPYDKARRLTAEMRDG